MKKRITVERIIDEYDMFGAEVPHMTIEGKQVVGTSIGFIATVLFGTIMTAFASLQAWIVVNHHNPLISVEESSDAFLSKDDMLNITDSIFMAFTV